MICKECNVNKDIENFYSYKKNNKIYYTKCKSCVASYNKKYKLTINPEAYLKSKNKHREIHKEYYKSYNKKYQKERRDNDPLFRLAGLLRNSIYRSFKGMNSLNENTKSILGIDIENFREYLLQNKDPDILESECHIDHIIPLKVAFDIKDKKERYQKLLELNHYTNLRLISALENLSKGSKIIKYLKV